LAKRGKALFKAVCPGKCKSRDLPARLNLSSLAPEMNRLWEASIRDIKLGVVREHAALLVWERNNLRLTNVVEGADDEVEPDYQLSEGQQFVGTFHTHPYVKDLQGMAFSGTDIASAITDKENLSIVHSGSQVFCLARTEFTPRVVDETAIVKQERKLLRFYQNAFSVSQALFKINLFLCKQFKLGFYTGNTTGKLALEFRP